LINSIKALEDEMGGALFIRRPQIQLTILGRALRPHFRSIIKVIDKTSQIAAAFVAKSQRGNGRPEIS
jgi:DNA-binding transcriptional LysR family regulator